MKCKVIKPFSSRNLVLIANLHGAKRLRIPSKINLHLLLFNSFFPSVPHKKQMNDSTLDLFTEHEDAQDATIEELAAALEITVDYYIAEFMC